MKDGDRYEGDWKDDNVKTFFFKFIFILSGNWCVGMNFFINLNEMIFYSCN